MKDFRQFAIETAGNAGEIIRSHFSLEIEKEWKKDETPVTIADKKINSLVISEIEKNYPTHGIIGEEESTHTNSEYIWICDPIDGTIPFSHGYPTCVFSLALTHHGIPIVGVIYDAILDRMVVAERGKGAFLNGKKIHVRSEEKLSGRSIIELEGEQAVLKLREGLYKKGCYVSTMYSTVYPSMLVACGQFTAAVYCFTHPWDGAAVKIIVEEAGGKVTDLLGNDQRYDQKINGFIASNGTAHEELVSLFQQYSA